MTTTTTRAGTPWSTPASLASAPVQPRRRPAFDEELQVRAAEASATLQAAEILGEELQATIAGSDLSDLRSLAARNDVELDEVRLEPGPGERA